MLSRVYSVIFLCSLPVVAMAQAQQQSPEIEALQQKVLQLTGESLNWQAQAIAEKRHADELQKQLDAAKKAATPAK